MKTPSNVNTHGALRTSEPIRGFAMRDFAERGAEWRVCSAAQASARDQSAIGAGVPAFSLMLRAGTAAAEAVLRFAGDRLSHGVAVYAGSGNNGGDAYVVAAQLARAGVQVRVCAASPPRTPDAQRAEALAAPRLVHGVPTGREQIIIDGLLGTGHRGELRGPIAAACGALAIARSRGACIVALDVPTGLDATSGDIAVGSVAADLTVSFGTFKRGQLIARAHVGTLQLADIGLGAQADGDDDAWRMPSARWLASKVPVIAWNAHKGTRGHVAVVGGADGMAGAVMLAARGALRTGCGLVRAWVDAPGVSAVQQAVPHAITYRWPHREAQEHEVTSERAAPWGGALAIGPGLGRSAASLALLQRALQENAGIPIVLDADALSLLAMHDGTNARGDGLSRVTAQLREIAERVPVLVLTPHAGEFARLTGAPTPADWQSRSDVLREFAARSQATVLLKGTPTLIASSDGAHLRVVARGTAVLATGGSGDVLTGMLAALLAQGADGSDAAMLAATAHGMAAELVARAAQTLRGPTLDDVLDALPAAWHALEVAPALDPGILASLPDVHIRSRVDA